MGNSAVIVSVVQGRIVTGRAGGGGSAIAGQGEEDVVEVRGVHRQVRDGDARGVQPVQHRAHGAGGVAGRTAARNAALVAGNLRGQRVLVHGGGAQGGRRRGQGGRVGDVHGDVPAGNQALQLRRAALGDDPPVVEHPDPVGQLVGFF